MRRKLVAFALSLGFLAAAYFGGVLWRRSRDSTFPGWIWGRKPPRRPRTVSGFPGTRMLRTAPRQGAGQPHGTSSSQAPYPSLPAKAESSLISLLLLSKPNPLRWASVWDGGCAAAWEKTVLVWENQTLGRTGAPLRAGTEDAYSGKIRPSQARDSPRQRCPQ